MPTAEGTPRTARMGRLGWIVAFAVVACGGGSAGDQPGAPSPSPLPSTAASPSATPPSAPPPAPTMSRVDPGQLDASFGDGGLAVVRVGGPLGLPPRGLVVLADGRTALLAMRGSVDGSSSELLRIELPADGRAADAVVTRPLPELRAPVAAFAPDGSAMAIGRRGAEIVATRLTPAGDLDTTFGRDGFASTGLESASDVLPLAGGASIVLGDRDGAQGLVRLDADGSRDASFGRDGFATPPAAPAPEEGGRYVLRQLGATSGGELFVAGAYNVAIVSMPRLFAFTASGEIDAAYGDAGIVAPSLLWPASHLLIGRDDLVRLLVRDQVFLLDADGQVVATVELADTPYGAGFGALGEAPDGGLILVGSSWVPDEPRRFGCGNRSDDTCLRLAIAAQSIRADGTVDQGFGDGGIAVTDLPAPYGAQDTRAQAVVAAPEGRITVAGLACPRPYDCDVVVLRYGAP